MPVADNVRLGQGVMIPHPQLVNLYDCSIGAETKIGTFVEIQKNAQVGARCKMSSHTFICEGVRIEDELVSCPPGTSVTCRDEVDVAQLKT